MTRAIIGLILAVGSSPAASIVVKATIAMALGLTGVWLARRSRAAVRHALLAAALGVLLFLPVASFLARPIRIAVPAAAQEQIVQPPLMDATQAMSPIAQANVSAGARAATQRWPGLSLSALLFVAWIAGAILFLLPVAAGMGHVLSLRRSGLPWRHGQSVVSTLAFDAGIRRHVELLLHEALPGPMTCGLVHPALVLPSDAQTWEPEDLNRAIVHELEHVRRCDWVSHCLARAVCAVYWFHPLVWIAWRQLALEAERSCDDAVLRRSEPSDYADQLVDLARRLSQAAKSPAAKPPLLAMANRADLATRVRALLDNRQRRGRAGVFSVALACIAAALLVIAISPLRMVAAPQSTPARTAPTQQFDAVSVKLIDPNMQGSHSHEKLDPGRLSMVGTMHRLIIRAYGITDGQLGGEPDWFKTHLYSVEAVTSVPSSANQMMLMLRGVLADRFQLKFREEYRDLPIYVLEVAAGGPKFKELKPGERPIDEPAPPSVFARSFNSVKELVNTLNGVFGGRLTVDRPVVDRTQLTRTYNIQFRTEMERQTDPFGRVTLQFPNLSRDIQSQLRLKLVSERMSMPYFLVEHAAQPTPN